MRIPIATLVLAVTTTLTAASVAHAGEADVIAAEALPQSNGLWRFDVTVSHADTGWDHYADAWEVLAPDGTVLGVRELLHPHVDEQPFTRSLSGVEVPDGVDTVTIRAHDSVHGYGGATFQITLPDR
ncbi:MAG: hypothetical protein RLO50_19640 [Azospirillaceae bacterium]